MAAVSFRDTLKAAVLSGLIAGTGASLFHFFFTEPVIERAIETEAELSRTRGTEIKDAVVSRETQRLGLILGFLLYGLIWGLICSVCLYLTQNIYPVSWSTTQRAFALVALVGWSVALFPFLKYPANPPGVGDPETVAYRQWLYLGFIALSVLSALTALSFRRLLGWRTWLALSQCSPALFGAPHFCLRGDAVESGSSRYVPSTGLELSRVVPNGAYSFLGSSRGLIRLAPADGEVGMIWAIGIGPGHPELLTLKAKRLIEEADVVAGFESVLSVVRHLIRGKAVALTYQNQVEVLGRVAAANRAGEKCVVCFMGDPNFSGYQLLDRLEAACGGRVDLIPGISSVQMVASKTRLPLDEAAFISFHKRGDIEKDKEYLVAVIRQGRSAIVLPRPWDFMPAAIAKFLIARGIPQGMEAGVYEKLSSEEAEWRGTLMDLSRKEKEFSDMSILVIWGAER